MTKKEEKFPRQRFDKHTREIINIKLFLDRFALKNWSARWYNYYVIAGEGRGSEFSLQLVEINCLTNGGIVVFISQLPLQLTSGR